MNEAVTRFEVELLRTKKTELEKELEQTLKDIRETEHKAKVTQEARLLLEQIKTVKIKQKKDFILKIVNTALSDIFDYDIQIAITSSDEDEEAISNSRKLKMRYNIILYENGVEIGRDEKLLSSNGGGILSVISLLLKILTGYIYSKNIFFVFDESLAQVSAKYQERLSLFLKRFCDEYGFTIILVTHNPELSTHAHMQYYFEARSSKNGLKRLTVSMLEGDYAQPEPPYYYIDVKNFQSIESISLKFKGFVTITGPNNIGKSATVRAINSLIFNDFQQSYLRKEAKRSEIVFGNLRAPDSDTWVKMLYDGKTVKYEFDDGEQLTGKKLAYDKIKEKIERVGFRYLELNKMYKNWKSDLKTQTDRLYVTTQHDKLYLIGSKSADSDKIFNFLFNAEHVAQAILDITYDERELVSRLKNLDITKKDIERRLKAVSLKYEIQLIKYNFFVYETFVQTEKKIFSLNLIRDCVTDITVRLKKIEHSISSISGWIRVNESVIGYRNLYTDLQDKTKTVSETLATVEKLYHSLHVVNRYRRANDTIEQHEQTVSKIKEIVKIYQKIVAMLETMDSKVRALNAYKQIDASARLLNDGKERLTKGLEIVRNIISVIEKISIAKTIMHKISVNDKSRNNLTQGKETLTAWFEDFKSQLGIETCNCCNGSGIKIKETTS